ncbi:MAG: replicative DNA helicase [Oscillospiraceae bacterium]|jgi:replicative DNA helicase|nr:replicative DNA helicase [Oscillospiraceae bacterium]
MKDGLTQIDGMSFPYSPEAEQAVLGAVLLDSEFMNVAIEILPSSENFYLQEHKNIYSVMLSMFAVGEKIDYITVLEKISLQEPSEEARCKSYLLELAQIVPSISSASKYAQIVKEKYDIRALMISAQDILQSAREGENAEEILEFAEQKIFDIRNGNVHAGFSHINEVLIQTVERLDTMLHTDDSNTFSGLPTGFGDLDRVIMGLNKTDLILIAARPGMGKTSFALNIVENVSKQKNAKVAIFSLEMNKEQLVSRMISSEGKISGQKLRSGKLENDEWERLLETCGTLRNLNISIDDTASITVPEMKARLRRFGGADLAVIDYLQLLSSSKENPNRVQEISSITRQLKIMAKELTLPVICLSQLSRASEHRSEHRPVLSDLRDSGSIEQDSDIVMFLYRESYYANSKIDENINHSESECIVAKNRHGETCSIPLYWQGEFTKFTGTSNY